VNFVSRGILIGQILWPQGCNNLATVHFLWENLSLFFIFSSIWVPDGANWVPNEGHHITIPNYNHKNKII